MRNRHEELLSSRKAQFRRMSFLIEHGDLRPCWKTLEHINDKGCRYCMQYIETSSQSHNKNCAGCYWDPTNAATTSHGPCTPPIQRFGAADRVDKRAVHMEPSGLSDILDIVGKKVFDDICQWSNTKLKTVTDCFPTFLCYEPPKLPTILTQTLL